MNRRRATQLAEQLLGALHAGREEWPLCIVSEVSVFGSTPAAPSNRTT
ncbi:hypothetical protein ACFPIJ_12055 [Dactylosporangium cerinum]|uniref:Uncharacterized protein n=1 Tax=Dactylosporangium cerinum TaxID=1434730 RepID=A0ABV9VSR3_9ACTN